MAKKNEYITEIKYPSGYTVYKIRLHYLDENGIRKEIAMTFNEKTYGTKQKALEQAKKELAIKKASIHNETIIKEKSYTLKDVFELTLIQKNVRLSTKDHWEKYYNKYIASKINEKRKFKSIKYFEIQDTLNVLSDCCTNDTINRVSGLWKRLYDVAIRNDIVIKDESRKIEKPQSELIETKREKTTSAEEIDEIIHNIKIKSKSDNRNAFLMRKAIRILYYTGMRTQEVFAIKKSNLSFIDGHYYYLINESLGTSTKEKDVIRQTKTYASIRTIPLNDELKTDIEELMKNSESDYLFIGNNGKFLFGENTIQYVNRYKPKDSTFTLYVCRNNFHTILETNGIDLRTIDELVGHKTQNTTISYVRSNNELKWKAINLMPKLQEF